jgi:hypothetical protein
MPSALRSRLTYANVVATLALVFAMSGGALAATHYLITSTKQISPKVLKDLKGKGGAAGTAGATGKEGAAGKEGKAGANGANGDNGESVSMAEVKAGEAACNELGGSRFTLGGKETTACNGEKGKAGKAGESVTNVANPANCKEGGAEFRVGSGTATYACNGEKGPKGEEGNIKATLPPGATETGAWSFAVSNNIRLQRVPISFPIPLAASLSTAGCPSGSECHIHIAPVLVQEGKIGAEPGELCDDKSGTELKECEAPYELTRQDCPSTVAAPTAEPGNLCIYIKFVEAVNLADLAYEDPGNSSGEVGTTGLILGMETTGAEGGEGEGTWAVREKVS